ncbi:hypothetical protein C5167_026786 [Papaver somniferum]|uniref:3-ketoacyl-CoA synthase 4-like n=1 Tax=Papaver somniferum TaxID=3469 RepID=UPI000E7006AA|nr:3-ketoacyl-CoA synthase 4-like [Papaver somniferum]RZC86114.1 hypothetical protein C5167_026786 [Papaver somniferum]
MSPDDTGNTVSHTDTEENQRVIPYVSFIYNYLINNLLISLFIVPVSVVIFIEAARRINPEDTYNQLLHQYVHQNNVVCVMVCLALTVFGLVGYWMSRPFPIYLVDCACYKPPSNLKVSCQKFLGNARRLGYHNESWCNFMGKILEVSGLGDETYVPQSVHEIPQDFSMASGRDETEQVIFGALDNLFSKTFVKAQDIGILVVNCSLFNPIPSLSSVIVNKYKLRDSIKSFNLGGMGCSTGVIAVDVAKNLLQIHRNTYAIVVSTENIQQGGYLGKNKSMLISNCLFRIGGAAVLLSSRSQDKQRAKYKLVHIVRTHFGSDDKAYKCVMREEDEAGLLGVSLSKTLMPVAGLALKTNITTLGPFVLPISEQLRYFITMMASKLIKCANLKTYIPEFKLAFDHFCIHAGGKAVIDEMEKNLKLSPIHIEPSRMTLHRFGNTSSSSIWYELAYIEAKGRMHKNHLIWQIALGSGFKCNSAVWIALKNVKPSSNDNNPWEDCIDRYPVESM